MGVGSHRWIPAGKRLCRAGSGSGVCGSGVVLRGCGVACGDIRHDVHCMNAFVTRLFIKRDGLASFKGFVAFNLDGRKVREQIVAAAVFYNEAVSLGVVEPLNLAPRHDELPRPLAVSFIIGVFIR